ncbi:MAG TPA: beta-lactamase family protein [Candidatus Limiplasma pullicola]|nr:beta-lactamase family protein [Candidatus Limiplasma pullicola]
MWKAVDDLLARGVTEGIFPGCAMAAGQGTRVLFTSVHGTLAQGDARGVTHTTRYDVGLLTEVMATVPLMLYALERGLVSLDDRLGRWLDDVPQDKREITLLHLLTHTSGMSASFLLSQEAESGRDALGALMRHPLSGSVGGKVRDSAMGFILLGFLLERVFGMPLDEAVKRFVTAPLRMPSTGYLPAGDDVAPAGGESEGAEWQAGQPQDGNARFLHGVAGHAGLFTDLEDIIRYASMLAGDGRNEEGVVFSYRSIHLATTERTRGLNEARGYGFRITKRSDPFLGHLWPSDGYGLADPASGSLIAVSPDDGFFVALLLNGHGTTDDRREITRMHKLLLNAAYAAFQHDEE